MTFRAISVRTAYAAVLYSAALLALRELSGCIDSCCAPAAVPANFEAETLAVLAPLVQYLVIAKEVSQQAQ